jgi:hypothetical protein
MTTYAPHPAPHTKTGCSCIHMPKTGCSTSIWGVRPSYSTHPQTPPPTPEEEVGGGYTPPSLLGPGVSLRPSTDSGRNSAPADTTRRAG